MKKIVLTLIILSSLACTKSKEEPSVFFVTPKNNEVVKNELLVEFGVHGKKLSKAGTKITDPKFGHHHILIDHKKGYIEKGHIVPMDNNHIHYGKGESSGWLKLTPGRHTISLQFANGAHISYGKQMSKTIEVIVQR